jgi:hypothetical protein
MGPLDNPASNHKSNQVLDRLNVHPHISRAIKCYMFHEKKNNNLRKKIIEIQLTTNFWARLSTSYCTPF